MKETGFPGYLVTEDGRVWSDRMDGRWLLPKLSTTGYLDVCLRRHGYGQMISVHRLVANAFVPNPTGLPWVNHIDGDKTNNRAENLEWVTAQGNARHANKAGLVRQTTARKSEASRELAQRLNVAKAARTGCARGHEFTPENTRIEGGSRRCLECRRTADAIRHHRKSKGELQ